MSDSPPLTSEDQPSIDIDESPMKQEQQHTSNDRFKTRPISDQKKNYKAPRRSKSRTSWSPKIDFPDDITNFPNEPVTRKSTCEDLKNKQLLFPDDALIEESNFAKGTQSQVCYCFVQSMFCNGDNNLY